MAYSPDLSTQNHASSDQTWSVARQQEITRTRVYVAMGFIRSSLGTSAWLEALNDEEFQAILTEIIPVVEAEKARRQELHHPKY